MSYGDFGGAGGGNGWNKYEVHVLSELNEMKLAQKELAANVAAIQADLGAQKVRSAWEFRILSAVWAAIVSGLNYFMGKL